MYEEFMKCAMNFWKYFELCTVIILNLARYDYALF